jgi:hypothetical protein
MREIKPSLDILILEFQAQIKRWYGIEEPLIKVTFSHEAFDALITEMYTNKNRQHISFTPAKMNDFLVLGVRVEARKR